MKPINQKWFLLGHPWCHPELVGTGIIAGNEDPQSGAYLLDLNHDDEPSPDQLELVRITVERDLSPMR